MRFMKDTKENLHSEMMLLWVMIMWVWFDMYPETGFLQAAGGIIALALIVRHAVLAMKTKGQS